MYYYLLQPSEEDDDQCKRATDRIWPKKTYRLSEAMLSPDNWVMYYLADGLERAFITEELMLIPDDIELPSDFVTLLRRGSLFNTEHDAVKQQHARPSAKHEWCGASAI